MRSFLIAIVVASAGISGVGIAQTTIPESYSSGQIPQCPSERDAVRNNCQGTLRIYGGMYVGEWKNNQFDGLGTLTFPDGRKYVGEWKAGLKNGQGTETYADGTKYIGQFKDGGINGEGTFVAKDGSTELGIWKTVYGKVARANGAGISIKIEGNTFIVPVTINGTMILNFTIDTGASDVAIPADVVSALMRTGSMAREDFLGQENYQLADGSIVPSPVFNIRSLTVGDKIVQNVRANVTSAKGDLLLGQSFLSRFRSWSVDNKKRLLFLN